MTTTALTPEPRFTRASQHAVTRIAVGVDGYPEGRDAAALGALLARANGARLMLVAVHPTPIVVLPNGMNWKDTETAAHAMLTEVRETLAPGARVEVETDLSVVRGLERVVRRERCDLVVMGSSRHAVPGHVRIGKRTRQLLSHFECPLAVAPRELHLKSDLRIRRIGVGYDGLPEARAALALAVRIATAAEAEIVLRGAVDDRTPPIGWSALAHGGVALSMWQELIEDEVKSLRKQIHAAARGARIEVDAEVVRGRPADALLALSEEVDLLVIGSRHWGPTARVLLGSTGEALLHEAACPVLTVPRPSNER